MTPKPSAGSSIRRLLIALVTVSLLAISLAPVALAKPGGSNAAGSAACANGGYLNWKTTAGATFKNEGDCTRYTAKGGVLVAVVPPAPNLTLSPGTEEAGTPYLKNYRYDFGLGAGVSQEFTVTNSGTAPSQLLLLSAPPPAFDGSDPFCSGATLAPNATCTFNIAFAPPADCMLGDQYLGQFSVAGIDPASGTPDDRYIRLNVEGDCPNRFAVVYANFGTDRYTVAVTGTGLQPGTAVELTVLPGGGGSSGPTAGTFSFSSNSPCSLSATGITIVATPLGGVETTYNLPGPDATICPPGG